MKLKHWSGYGTVVAKRIPNASCTLHVHVEGDHECGLRRDDEYDLFYWLVKRFDRSVTDYASWHSKDPKICIIEWSNFTPGEKDCCDYYFTY